MKTVERRKKIKSLLEKSNKPIKGIDIAKEFNVSRQVIVQDMAILKAEGFDFVSTPVGYMILKTDNSKIIKRIAVKHGFDEIEKELNIILKYNGVIKDIIIEHSIYGEIKGNLNINNNIDLQEFLKVLDNNKDEPLSYITNGLHIHTIEVEKNSDYESIIKELKEEKILFEN
ncbi:MAG: transcription repressor NadR [Andreesenia angusta]|nr:transcription repressor NadR [Andreesenia angusta]